MTESTLDRLTKARDFVGKLEEFLNDARRGYANAGNTMLQASTVARTFHQLWLTAKEAREALYDHDPAARITTRPAEEPSPKRKKGRPGKKPVRGDPAQEAPWSA